MVILKSGVSNYVNLDDKQYSYFAGNNYLGLANDPHVIKEAVTAIQNYGINFSASRQTTGTSELHLRLEKLLSEFSNKEDSVVFASGYMANRIILQTLRKRYSAIYYDELSHPSIIDGFPRDQVSLIRYDHSDLSQLEQLLIENKNTGPLIITDGIFPLTGEIARLDKIYELALKYGAIVVVDDAHSLGVLGKNGRGTAEFFGLAASPVIYQTGTMSKAFGAYGGFISADGKTIDHIRKTSSCYMASTSLPPSIVGAAISSVGIAANRPDLRDILSENANVLKKKIKEMGYFTFQDPTPIIPIFFSKEEKAINLSAHLRKNNIIVPYVKYPVKMDKFIVRITVSSVHTKEQIHDLLEVLNLWRKNNEIDQD